ncbi:hypothetical protein KEM54_001446 [Ascosphaera aggregata]|nr:hypothetical protein KEM54_001446 [Ascosphaera aggregata]
MESALHKRLLYRSIGRGDTLCRLPGLYSDRRWIDDLDIVSELQGHAGCVNALSWSQDGSLLASGSDDKHINIYSYQRDGGDQPFLRNTIIHTGHRANIFSVKFMPHSGDQTIVSCAGDHQVRVFDLEHSAKSPYLDNMHWGRGSGTQALHHEGTNCRIYRCHTNRVKRILTESSPYHFLTCSEDGDVRRWDIREPSSSYPSPLDNRLSPSGVDSETFGTSVPPPLISYRRQGLKLSTISCSLSQPHYIALGGSHLHCFLHDGRMAGRDLLSEQGVPFQSPRHAVGTLQDDKMDAATKCVRRFAPYGLIRERPLGLENCHITACKISNYNPNEMIVSWSGENIYSFDIIHNQDVRERQTQGGIETESSQPKRKRSTAGSSLSSRSRTRRRNVLDHAGDLGSHPIGGTQGGASNVALAVQSSGGDYLASSLTTKENEALGIAGGLCKIRGLLFGTRVVENTEKAWRLFEVIENMATKYLLQTRTLLRSWTYPLNPSEEQVTYQNKMRDIRQNAYRFVHIVRGLANTYRVCYAQTATTFPDSYPDAQLEKGPANDRIHFCYQFLRAIIMFAKAGRSGLVTSFKTSSGVRNTRLFPIPADVHDAAIEEYLIPHLSELASQYPVKDEDANRFDTDSSHELFRTEHAAVNAFAELLNRPAYNSDRRSRSTPFSPEQDEEVFRFWLLKVGRSLLIKATQDLRFDSINHAFGGAYWPRGVLINLARAAASELANEDVESGEESNDDDELMPEESMIAWGPSEHYMSPMGEQGDLTDQDEIDSDCEEGSLRSVSPQMNRSKNGEDSEQSPSWGDGEMDPSQVSGSNDLEEAVEEPDVYHTSWESNGDDDDDDDYDDGDLGDDDDDSYFDGGNSSDFGSEDSEDSSAFALLHSHRLQACQSRIERHAPCISHVNEYVGHCNVETLKDVNYFGQNDEYVVSGSDSGHLFIWDKTTTKLVNILLGDNEVVNVIQGHPYEPMLAVSGIDDTVKIFSPDRHAQRLAHLLAPEPPLNRRHHSQWPLNLSTIADEPDPSLFDEESDTADMTAAFSDTFDMNETIDDDDDDTGGDQQLSQSVAQFSEGDMMDTDDEDPYHGTGSGLDSRKCMHVKDKILDNERVRLRLNQAFFSVSPSTGTFAEVPRTTVSFQDSMTFAEKVNCRNERTSLIYADPHNPLRHLQRASIHFDLGFPDLAAADAYRALTLFEAVVDPESSEYEAKINVNLLQDLDALNLNEPKENADEPGIPTDSDMPDDLSDKDSLFQPVTRETYNQFVREVYIILVTSLVQCHCMRDAFEFCSQAFALSECASPNTGDYQVFEKQMEIIGRSMKPQKNLSTNSHRGSLHNTIDPSKLNAQGYARRVLYPWNTYEPDRESPETLKLLNERLKKVAPKCEVRTVVLPALHDTSESSTDEVSIQLGVVATEDIEPGEIILRETSLLTATNRIHDDLCDACNSRLPDLSDDNKPVACDECFDTVFCSEKCYDLARKTYHPAICGTEGLDTIGRDIPDPRDKADYLYLLLVGRAISMAATQHLHPLELPEIKYIWGDFHQLEEEVDFADEKTGELLSMPKSASLPFSFHLNILQPMRILEGMGVDPFSCLPSYDTWVLNTMYAKFRGTASGRLSTWDGGPEVCAVHPLWCLANHSCDPNVRWEWGGEITFTARTDEERVEWGDEERRQKRSCGIAKGEEILNHYCDINLTVHERREWAEGALGGLCQCRRCIWEANQTWRLGMSRNDGEADPDPEEYLKSLYSELEKTPFKSIRLDLEEVFHSILLLKPKMYYGISNEAKIIKSEAKMLSILDYDVAKGKVLPYRS